MSTKLSELDFDAVLQAANLISREVFLDSLLRKLMQVLIEHASAQKVVLVLKEDSKYLIEGVAEVSQESGTDRFRMLRSVPVAESTDLPQSVFGYVSRTGSTLVLNDAVESNAYSEDPYIKTHQVRSVLAVPLFHQEQISAIIYLENSLMSYAFTPQRMEFLRLLSGQAAISLENARLFDRTESLARSANRFVPHDLLSLFGRKFEDTVLGDGVLQENLTILVSDIRGFTGLSEHMSPEENFRFINDYLRQVGPLIRNNEGFIGKYTGDGLMAFFPRSTDDALTASLQTLERIGTYNEKKRANGEREIRIGIGLHRGNAMLGIIGETERLQCDAMSDAANLAARLEGLSSILGASILLSEQAFSNLENAEHFEHRSLGVVRVTGRIELVSVYEVFQGDEKKLAQSKANTKQEFAQGLTCFQAGQFEESSKLFASVCQENPLDSAAKLYLEDSLRLMRSGIPAGWEGAPTLNQKKKY